MLDVQQPVDLAGGAFQPAREVDLADTSGAERGVEPELRLTQSGNGRCEIARTERKLRDAPIAQHKGGFVALLLDGLVFHQRLNFHQFRMALRIL
jgi:hypothetical protein